MNSFKMASPVDNGTVVYNFPHIYLPSIDYATYSASIMANDKARTETVSLKSVRFQVIS